MDLAGIRARQALSAAGLPVAQLQRVGLGENEVWISGGFVLRVNPRPQSGRLAHEARVAELLGPEVGHPGVLAFGLLPTAEWLLVRRMPGVPLARRWPAMLESERRHAAAQVAERLAALHRTTVPTSSAARLAMPFATGLSDPHPTAPHQLDELRHALGRRRDVDQGLVSETIAAITAHRSAFEGAPTVLVHGDPHFENVLWDGSHITALLDMEFARPAWAEVDLEVLLRFFDAPQMHVAPDYAGLVSRNDYREVQAWMADAHPGLFASPRLSDRLTVLSAAFDLRSLVTVDPSHAGSEWHPARRLRRLLDGRDTLSALAW
jgi:aminoglycoside phosphotransferase (APT) family kinase protein